MKVSSENILEVINLKKYFKVSKGIIKAVDDISFNVKYGETFGLVGESGSGKSTTGHIIVGLYAPTSGKILFEGRDVSMGVERRPLALKKKIQMVFQDPATSLNPKRTVRQIIELPLKVHGICHGDTTQKVAEILQMVELPVEYMERYPTELGGGEKQMVAIARALAVNPSFIVLDEPTSALDVSIQAKIINMLMRVQKEFNLSYLFITHNLSLMRNVASRVAIMYLGKIVELASTEEFFYNPLHPYTKMLLSSIPVITDEEEAMKPKKIISTGEIPGALNVPPGCSFHPRCPERLEVCDKIEPCMLEIAPGHFVKCHLYNSARA